LQVRHHPEIVSLLHPWQGFGSVPALDPKNFGHAPQYKPQYPSKEYSMIFSRPDAIRHSLTVLAGTAPGYIQIDFCFPPSE
jgi:hypothetical protein